MFESSTRSTVMLFIDLYLLVEWDHRDPDIHNGAFPTYALFDIGPGMEPVLQFLEQRENPTTAPSLPGSIRDRISIVDHLDPDVMGSPLGLDDDFPGACMENRIIHRFGNHPVNSQLGPGSFPFDEWVNT